MARQAFPSLKNRVVLVTGGTRGLGREMALALAEAGARVAITGKSESAALHDSAQALRQVGSEALAIVADVRTPRDCERAVRLVCERYGRLDVLINNAGLGMRPVSETYIETPPKFWEADPAAWRDIVDTNINGVFNMSRASVPGMMAQRFGKLINLTTSANTMTRKGLSPYGPSKIAVEAMSRVWAKDLESTGVDVNVFLPGSATDTDILPDTRRKDTSLLAPAIMRAGILWLCADQSNGQTAGRYVAKLWNESLPPDEAAAGAREDLPI